MSFMLHHEIIWKAGQLFFNMIKVSILCVGKLKESFWRSACSEYEKRLSPFCRFIIHEIPECRLPENPSEAQIAIALNKEGSALLSSAKGSSILALCIEGKELSSIQLAQKIEGYAVHGCGALSFLIGSSFGLSDEVKQKADLKLSMSPMTFPHQLARVMLCEQIYRSFEIIHHGKYHK